MEAKVAESSGMQRYDAVTTPFAFNTRLSADAERVVNREPIIIPRIICSVLLNLWTAAHEGFGLYARIVVWIKPILLADGSIHDRIAGRIIVRRTHD